MRADQGTARLLAKGTLAGHMHYQRPQGGPVGYDLTFPLFKYKGPQATVKVNAAVKLALKLVDNVKPINKDGYATMRMTPRGKVLLVRAGDSNPITLYSTDDAGKSLWDQSTGAHSEEDLQLSKIVTLPATSSDQTYSLVLRFEIDNQVSGSKTATDPGGWAKGRIEYELRAFRLMWG